MNKIFIILIFCICNLTIAEDKILNIYVSSMPPCVIVSEDETSNGKAISGFEMDLWKEIGKDLVSEGIIKSWNIIPVEWEEIETNIKNKNADIAFSGLTIRSSRMEWADFSIPTMNSGLGIMVLKTDKEGGIFYNIIMMYNALKSPALLFIIFILCFSCLIWFLERDDNPNNDINGISDKFFPGIFEAIYFCVVTCSTVGYGDYTPKKWPAKIVVMALIFAGIVAFCNFTALLSAEHVTDSIGDIKSVSDLKGKVVITQKGTTSADYVKLLGAKSKTVDNIEGACDNLLLERGDAVVFDYPVLLNYVKDNPDKVKMVGGMFDEQYYGFMLQKDSPIKRDIDLSILRIYEDGTYKAIYDKWF